MNTSEEQLIAALHQRLSSRRAAHTLSVAKETDFITDCFALTETDRKGLRYAALLHDFTKEDSAEEQLGRIRSFGFALSEDDLASAPTLHAISGYVCARTDYELEEPYALAILRHSTGERTMRLWDKILFTADYIEEGRPYDNCKQIRSFFHEGMKRSRNLEERLEILNRAVYNIANNTVEFLIHRHLFIHPNTLKMRNTLIPPMKGSH